MKNYKALINFFLKRYLGIGIHSLKPNYDIDIYKSLYTNDVLKNKLFYNIGVGNFYHPYWINADYSS